MPAPSTSMVSQELSLDFVPSLGFALSLGFAIDDVAAHDRIVLAQLKSIRIVASIFRRQIHVRAFCAAHLDELTRSLFRHSNTPSFSAQTRQNSQKFSITHGTDEYKFSRLNPSIRWEAHCLGPLSGQCSVILSPVSQGCTCRSVRTGARSRPCG